MAEGLIITLLAGILVALFVGLFYLIREKNGESRKILNSLILRVTLTLILALLLIVGLFMGWLVPHPVGG